MDTKKENSMQHDLRRFGRWVAWFALVVWVAAVPARAGDKQAAKRDAAYEQIKDYIYDERYEQALAAAQAFLKKYPTDQLAQEATFWSCWAIERTNDDYGKAFECYRSFLETYPNGKWVDDATIEYTKLAQRLAKAGDPRGKAALDALRQQGDGTDDDADFKLAVLYALLDSGDDELAMQSINELLKSPDPDVRRRAIYVLSDVDDPDVLDA
jgi:tetratricopeptide (TPR) repeat protein